MVSVPAASLDTASLVLLFALNLTTYPFCSAVEPLTVPYPSKTLYPDARFKGLKYVSVTIPATCCAADGVNDANMPKAVAVVAFFVVVTPLLRETVPCDVFHGVHFAL